MGPEVPLQIPPTRVPRRRRVWPRGWRITTAVVFGAVLMVATSAAVNHEVSQRLATVPPVTTPAQPTGTTLVARHVAPRAADPAQDAVAPVEVTTTSTTTPIVEDVPKSAYDIITELDALPVEDEHPFGYGAYRFGLWRDDDGDGCNTRDDVLIHQAIEVVSGTHPCHISAGEWHSPYDNVAVSQPDDMAVDHVVGIYEAWKSGAWQWTDQQRNDYLNDQTNAGAILAVSHDSAQQKAGRDPKDWLPDQTFRCKYLQTWVDMKTVWHLSVDAGEREAIAAAALDC